MVIKFGTSGWRAIIADEFTTDNVKLVTQAIANYVKSSNENVGKEIVVGYDTRFMSEKFAEVTAGVLAANDIPALLCDRDTPTPVIGYEIVRRKIAGGINFTASHNPPEYNGIKFSPSWGGPALPEVTKTIETQCIELEKNRAQIKYINFEDGKKQRLIKIINPRPTYLKRIRELADLDTIRKGNLKIVVDVLYGTGRDYLDTLLAESKTKLKVIHNWRDVLFNGAAPEPNEKNLAELRKLQKKEKACLGLSVDGDADRFGILDSDGTFIAPNQIISLLFYYLLETRRWQGVVARTVMTTHLIDALAKKYGIKVRETPVGFKFIGEVMCKEPMVIGGEESGGLTIKGHIPEKDGILACLLVAELRAWSGKSLKQILNKLYSEVGYHYTDRINYHLQPEQVTALREKLATNPPKQILGTKIIQTNTLDGFKFVLGDGSWLGVRLSGTEPVVRYYIESDTTKKLKSLAKFGEKFVLGYWE